MALPAIARVRDHFAGNVLVVVKSRLESQLIELAFPELTASTLVASEFGRSPLVRWARIALALRRARISDIAGLHLRDRVRGRGVAYLSGASRVVFNKFDLEDGRHKSAQYAALVDELIGNVVPVAPFQLAEFAARRPTAQIGDIVLAPGSGIAEAHKRWPPTRYGELIRLLHSRDASTSFTLLGAPSERALLESIAALVHDTGAKIRIVAPSSLRDSLLVLSEARVVIGGCSGSLHVAALVDAPIIGVYGPTNPGWTAPTASVVRIVRRGHLCSPCYALDFVRGCGNADCMDIAAVAVAAALDDIENDRPGDTLQWFPLSRLRVARAARAANGFDGCDNSVRPSTHSAVARPAPMRPITPSTYPRTQAHAKRDRP
jgi:hypothetical protein